MKSWRVLFAMAAVAAVGMIGLIWSGAWSELPTRFAELRDRTGIAIEELRKEIVAPPPLRSDEELPSSRLSQPGVVRETNRHRRLNGLAALAENAKLNAAAAAKLADMFDQQYFAHVGPDGNGPSHWAEEAGYSYIVLGENLALGDYEDDAALVQAWMDSPPHRENILDARYQEIGVAVGKGKFEGRMTWLAVQEFGKPLASCPAPSVALRADIDDNNRALDILLQKINALRAELESTPRRNRDEYNQKVVVYNATVAEYNALLDATKSLVAQFNAHVAAYNACIVQ